MYSEAMSVLRTDVRMGVTMLALPQEVVRRRPHSSLVQDALEYVSCIAMAG